MNILLVTPPFTQINTPYPAAQQLSAFLKGKGHTATSLDLSIKTLIKVFSKTKLEEIIESCHINSEDEESHRFISLKSAYINTIEPVIHFLQGNNLTLANKIISGNYLPQGTAFTREIDESYYFGSIGKIDKARYYCSLYLEDITNFIINNVTPHFGLSRYAEKIGVSLANFNKIKTELERKPNIIEQIILEVFANYINEVKPKLVAFTIPFPGNLLSALICARYIKQNHPEIKTAIGGGYVNTELRELSTNEIFNYVDYITYDDGETPLLGVIENIETGNENKLVRTLMLKKGKPQYINSPQIPDLPHHELTTPNYKGINPDEYISFIEMLNPMHMLWGDGFWHKITLAHGCYWKKCTFCDVTLDYIGRYQPGKAEKIVDSMEELANATGKTGFHFTDEAAPPALLRDISVEIIKRKLNFTWWGNIRFEQAFTSDVCKLMAKAGCIAVSGGLEVADNRLLKLINKGVTVKQVAGSCFNFKEAGIMVHAYLMYGFPTQTEQETVNSLELVRQFMEHDLIQSGFWHMFTLTVHSPIAKNPEKFGVTFNENKNSFANNDLTHKDDTGTDHSKFSFGLKKAMYNYMNGIGLDQDVRSWFEFRLPASTINKNYIGKAIEELSCSNKKARHLMFSAENIELYKEKTLGILIIDSVNLSGEFTFELKIAEWLHTSLIQLAGKIITTESLYKNFPGNNDELTQFNNNPEWQELKKYFIIQL